MKQPPDGLFDQAWGERLQHFCRRRVPLVPEDAHWCTFLPHRVSVGAVLGALRPPPLEVVSYDHSNFRSCAEELFDLAI